MEVKGDVASGPNLRKLAAEHADTVLAESKDAEHLGSHHRTWQYVFAGGAVVLGVGAGAGGLWDIATLAGAAGLAASALAAFQSKSDLNSGVLSRFHFRRAAGLADVSRRYRALAEGPDDPTR